MTDEEKIRWFESEVLDKIYLEKEFYQYSDDIVIPYLLQTYGDTERHFEGLIKKGYTETTISFYLHNMMHGISHCIRWIKSQNAPKYDSIKGDQYAHTLSMDFVNWGIAYHAISQEFVAWSRGIKKAILNDRDRKIIFTIPEYYDYDPVFKQQLLYKKQIEITYNSYPHEEMQHEFTLWLKNIDLTNPPIANSVDWSKPKKSKIYPLLLSKIQELIFPELPGDTELGDYTLDDLRRFCTLLYFNFYFIRWIEGVIDEERGVNHSFGSNPLYLEEQELIKLTSLMTDLDKSSLASIIKDLTFDHTNFHSNLSNQPFVKSNSGKYYILPNLFYLIEPSRMISGAMNKGSKKKIYDRLINQIETVALADIFEIISNKKNWLCFKQKSLKISGKQIQPDLLIIDIKNTTILIIDYKHFLSPVAASEVDYKIKELTKGLTQINKYMELIKATENIFSLKIKDCVIIGMIVSHKPLPIPIPLKSGILITDKKSFVNNLQKDDQQVSLSAFTESFVANNINDSQTDLFLTDEEITLRDWTIVRKMLKTASQ